MNVDQLSNHRSHPAAATIGWVISSQYWRVLLHLWWSV
jgi:hypothetical protein